MDIGAWFAENTFNLFSAVGVIGSLWFTAVSFRSETKTRKVANLLTITANHRELWKVYLTSKDLARVRDILADTRTLPVTQVEWVFVGMVIQHSNSGLTNKSGSKSKFTRKPVGANKQRSAMATCTNSSM